MSTSLDSEFFPTQFSAIPSDNPFRAKTRRLANEVGHRIFAHRLHVQDVRPIGVHFWAWHVAESMTHDKNKWRQIPDVASIRRRINELADARYFRPTPWLRLSKDYEDLAPNIPFASTLKFQSSYLPNPELNTDYSEFLAKFIPRQVAL